MSSIDNTYKPKVSIIIPVYNVKPYVAEALNSVINQTYKNLEIIVIDDGSNDGSEKICDEYAKKDNRIKLLHKENGGLSSARNVGLDNMSGEYVAFLDSDDAYYPEAIEKMLKYMLLHDADCVVCKYTECKTEKRMNFKKTILKKKEKIYSKSKAIKSVIEHEIQGFSWDKLYKQNLFNNLRYPVGQNFEDLYVILDILNKTQKVIIINDKLVCYRKHRKSICATDTLKNFQDLFKAHDNIEQFIQRNMSTIFTDKELKKFRQHFLNLLLCKYTKTLYKNIPNKQEILFWLKEKIKERYQDNEGKKYSLETHLIIYVLYNYPKIFSTFSFFYLSVRKFIWNFMIKLKDIFS